MSRTSTKESPNPKFCLSTSSPSTGLVMANMQYTLQDAVLFSEILTGPANSGDAIFLLLSFVPVSKINSCRCFG